MPIYTRKGDKGKTTLFNGRKVSKSNLRIETLGAIDELNSAIGFVLSSRHSTFAKALADRQVLSIKKELIKIQNDLLGIGSALASQGQALQEAGLERRVKEFENIIDKMTEQMPSLRNFILPGGGKTGAKLHLARAICRRAERRVVELNNKRKLDINIIAYLNRLSDLLFTLARLVNFKEKKKEITWPA